MSRVSIAGLDEQGAPPLTWLYVPGDRPDRVQKALNSDADVVVIDLEDAVAPSSKQLARDATADLLQSSSPKPVVVRINDLSTPWAVADMKALAQAPGLAGLRIPKVVSADQLAELDQSIRAAAPTLPLHCLIESAAGLENAFQIASYPGVTAVGLGEADLTADLGVVGDSGLAWARGRLVVAARAAGLPPPAQSVYLHLDDDEGLARSCEAGRSLGFFGRAAIHPKQLPIIVDAYLPSAAELDAARQVIQRANEAAEAEGVGALVLSDGRFVDLAVVLSARRILAVAKKHGTRREPN